MRGNRVFILGLSILLAVPGGLVAQSKAPCADPLYRQFDFWVGNWDVTNPQGQMAGKNSITLEENGCLVHEHWTGAGPGTGQSLNFYDQHDHHWHQQWIDNSGNALALTGDFTDGKMVLIGHNMRGGKPASQRITWSRSADGSVRQLWETSLDDGKSWTTSFDGKYEKK